MKFVIGYGNKSDHREIRYAHHKLRIQTWLLNWTARFLSPEMWNT